jgi:diketogulonate reductase-like aldo/keto reductase
MSDHTLNTTRRELLRLGAAAAGTLMLPSVTAAAATPLMRAIPSTAEKIPAVGMGTWQTFDVGATTAARAGPREVLTLFAAHGGRLIDSSPMYGEAESVVGDLAADLKLTDKLFLATKVWTSGHADGIRQMEQSLRRLRVSRLDLMQVHNLLDWETHLRTLREWKAQGRVRYLGITHYTESAYPQLERVMQGEDIDFVQFNYSIVSRAAEQRLLPLAHERRIAVLVNRPFEKAGLFGKVRGKELPAWSKEFDCESWAQFFLKFILSHPAVTGVLPATSKPEHLRDNMQAGVGRLPDAATREKMARYVQSL